VIWSCGCRVFPSRGIRTIQSFLHNRKPERVEEACSRILDAWGVGGWGVGSVSFYCMCVNDESGGVVVERDEKEIRFCSVLHWLWKKNRRERRKTAAVLSLFSSRLLEKRKTDTWPLPYVTMSQLLLSTARHLAADNNWDSVTYGKGWRHRQDSNLRGETPSFVLVVVAALRSSKDGREDVLD